MKSLEVRVFLILSVSNQFQVDGARENVRAGYKATLLCSVSEQWIDNNDKIYVALASGPFYRGLQLCVRTQYNQKLHFLIIA